MKIRIPLSRKVVLAALAGLVGTGLNALGLYDVPADIQALITTAEMTAVAYGVPEAVSVANALALKFGLKDVQVVDEDDTDEKDPTDGEPKVKEPIVVDPVAKGDNV